MKQKKRPTTMLQAANLRTGHIPHQWTTTIPKQGIPQHIPLMLRFKIAKSCRLTFQMVAIWTKTIFQQQTLTKMEMQALREKTANLLKFKLTVSACLSQPLASKSRCGVIVLPKFYSLKFKPMKKEAFVAIVFLLLGRFSFGQQDASGLGIAKYLVKDYKGAILVFNEAIEENPQSADDYCFRGSSKNYLEDYRGALQDYNKAIELNQEFGLAYFYRGKLKITLEDYRGGIQDFNKAIELDSEFADAYINRGEAKSKLMDNRGAIQDHNKAIELEPRNFGAYYFRGLAKSDLKDYRGAIQDLTKSIELNSEFWGAYFFRAEAKSVLEDYRGAIQDFNNAIELEPNCTEAYFHRGMAKLIIGQMDSGCLDLSKAGELGYSDAYDAIKKYCN